MILAFSLGDSVVNHFASLCSWFSVPSNGSRGSGENARLCPALRARLSSCKKSDTGVFISLGKRTYLIAIFADGGAFGSCSVQSSSQAHKTVCGCSKGVKICGWVPSLDFGDGGASIPGDKPKKNSQSVMPIYSDLPFDSEVTFVHG